jgi:hypothetical protein
VDIDVDEDLLWTLAQRRIADARELLSPPYLRPGRKDAGRRHLQAAYYLAGYAVECALKAHIIRLHRRLQGTHVSRWSQVKGSVPLNLSGKQGHNLSRLLACAELHDCVRANLAINLCWTECRKWNPEVRYTDRPMDMPSETVTTYVVTFVDGCEAVRSWVYNQRHRLRTTTEE